MRTLLLIVIVGVSWLPTTALADSGSAQGCGIVGAWFGEGSAGFSWMATMTQGELGNVGQLNLEWVIMDPTLGGFFPAAVRVTNATGVWRKKGNHQIHYTWVAYGLAADGSVAYTARMSGTGLAEDCDHWSMDSTMELWLPEQDMGRDPPFFCAPGETALHTRMPIVQATCE